MDRQARFFRARTSVLERIVNGDDIEEILVSLCRDTEDLDPAMRCSVLLMDPSGHSLRSTAAPSLPDFYNDAIDGMDIGMGQGSCGTAAYTGEQVIVEDVDTHPYWEPFRALAQQVGFRASWSYPIISRHKRVLGTFAMYYDEVRSPSEDELQLIEGQAKLASIAIERVNAEKALREHETLLDSIFENVPIGLLIKNRDHIIERSNRTYQSWYGIGNQELVGNQAQNIESLTFEGGFKQAERQEQHVFETGEITQRHERRIFDDGERHTLRITKFPIYDQEGQIVKVGSVSVDLTEQVRAEEAAREALAEAERANRTKSEFIATMSHEFRTPLNAVIGFSEMLMVKEFDVGGSSRSREYAEVIHRSGKMILELVNDILDISAIEAGKREIHKEEVHLGALLEECTGQFSHPARDGGIDLLLDVPADLPPVSADERALKQIVLNLISNAVKFTEENGSVHLSASHKKGKTILQVQDDGVGIAEEKLPTITEPFAQSHSNPHVAEDGSGLGLSIVKSLVEMHDGDLDIRSTEGQGTTIRVTLPA